MKVLARSFFERDPLDVARDLIGKRIVRKVGETLISGFIAETEAYRSDDPASHSYRGKTARNRSMFGAVGHSYVYMSYGLHYCLNVVCRDNKYHAGGVLIRAFIPEIGQLVMEKHRKRPIGFVVSGPGNVGQALGLDLSFDGLDLTNSKGVLFVSSGIVVDKGVVHVTKRIGISKATENLWRFVIDRESMKEIHEFYAK